MFEWLQDAHNWVAISFVIFVVLAWVLGRKQVTGKLDTRIDTIRKDIETAETLKAEAQTLLNQYLQSQREATAEAAKIVDHARTSANDILRTAEQDIAEAAKRREQQLQERLKRMEQAAIDEIRARAADLAVKATAELIAAHMDQETNNRLVDQSIKDLAKNAA
jgi:F-type H+-transporting ATPase subunit b